MSKLSMIPKKILFIADGDIPTTQILQGMLEHLKGQFFLYEKVLINADTLDLDRLARCDIPFFVRCADPYCMLYLKCLQLMKKPFIYYIDDNFWALPSETPLGQYYNHPAVLKTLNTFISQAYCVIVNSHDLAQIIQTKNSSVLVLTPFYDFSLIENAHREPHDEIRIGFAGNPSRLDDLSLIVPAIRRILERYGRQVVFEFAGVLPTGLSEGINIRYFPPVSDYTSYMKWQFSRAWDIALAPLADRESNRSKTNNKYREYGACHIAGIYSNIEPYSSCVRDGVTGILAGENSADWFNALVRLIEDESLRKNIATAVEKHVRDEYSLLKVSQQWHALFEAFPRTQVSSSILSMSMRIKIMTFLAKLLIAYEVGGITSLARIAGKKLLKCIRRGSQT